MGLCRFKTSELKPLIEHALAATDFDMGYENMTDEQFAAAGLPIPTNRTPRGPALLFVHDSGVYLMSNGIPRLRPENPAQDVNSCHVAYADGCNPNVGEFDDWYGMSRDLVGGDDFVEILPIADHWLRACDQCETFELDVQPTSIGSRFYGGRQPQRTAQNDLPVPDRSVSMLKIGTRALRGLRKLNISTIGELTNHDAEDLLECQGFGLRSLDEVRKALALHNLTLRGETPEPEQV